MGWGEPGFISTQTLFDADTEVLSPGETYTFNVSVPACAHQVDLFEGPTIPQSNPDFGHPPLSNTHNVFDFSLSSGNGLCVPPGGDTGFITVIKNVINDNGGTAAVADFRLYVGGTRVYSGVEKQITVGTYTVSEVNIP